MSYYKITKLEIPQVYHNWAVEVDALKAENARQLAALEVLGDENARLREALEPFAKAGQGIQPDKYGPEHRVLLHVPYNPKKGNLTCFSREDVTVADFIKALAALNGEEA